MMYKVASFVIPAVVVLVIIRKLRERSWGYCKNKVTLNNKIAIVTGANCGIGYEVAKELASRNAFVILACRNVDAAKAAITKIEKEIKKELKMRAMELDLASLKSIKQFADNVQQLCPNIHLLVNNAGVAYSNKQKHFTEDNFEIHFGVNHLGHFYLTNLLLDTLIKSAPSRVVIVSSRLHEKGKLDFDQLEPNKVPADSNLYASSKLANAYFCKELSRRVQGTGVNVYAVCPGWVYTSLFRHSLSWYHYILAAPVAFFFMRSPKQGSQTVVYCATEPALENQSGFIYADCAVYSSKVEFSDDVALKLWNVSEKLINDALK